MSRARGTRESAEGMEFEEVAGNTLYVTGGTVLMLGTGSKGDSTKSLSQTFDSRDSQTKEGLTATLLKDFKEDFISLFLNPSERKQNRRDSEQNPLAPTSTAKQFTFHTF